MGGGSAAGGYTHGLASISTDPLIVGDSRMSLIETPWFSGISSLQALSQPRTENSRSDIGIFCSGGCLAWGFLLEGARLAVDRRRRSVLDYRTKHHDIPLDFLGKQSSEC